MCLVGFLSVYWLNVIILSVFECVIRVICENNLISVYGCVFVCVIVYGVFVLSIY